MNENLEQAINKKATIVLGENFAKYIQDVEKIGQIPSRYNLKDTIFEKYDAKFRQLQDEYAEELRKMGIKDYIDQRSNYQLQTLGETLAEHYPIFMKEAVAEVWRNMEEIYNKIMGEY